MVSREKTKIYQKSLVQLLTLDWYLLILATDQPLTIEDNGANLQNSKRN